jgi:4-hydroxythreonine-4-phosphate dehydrogenase
VTRWWIIASQYSADFPLAVALGDPAGIGPEIVGKAWDAREREKLSPFFAVGDPRSIECVWRGPVKRISSPLEAINVFDQGLPVVTIEDLGSVDPGHPNLEGARCALDALEMAIGLVRTGVARGLVTAPVSKAQLYAIGFTHSGQTEFIGERCGIAAGRTVMMLASPSLKVVPVTTHIPLAAVASTVTIEMIVSQASVTAKGLQRDFGITNPRLAFAGFNPHAGESGAIGREEIDLIEPAMAILRAEGIDVLGPFAADTMFSARARNNYDVAICLYHDQALIPIKTLDFDEGVNMTLGLPIIRTSPDHGTGFDIAGQDKAHPGAMIAAIRMADAAAIMRANGPAGCPLVT